MSYFSVVVASSFALIMSLVYASLINLENPAYGLSEFNIDAVGDWTCSSNAKSTENNIKDTSPELVLGLGDYSMCNPQERVGSILSNPLTVLQK